MTKSSVICSWKGNHKLPWHLHSLVNRDAMLKQNFGRKQGCFLCKNIESSILSIYRQETVIYAMLDDVLKLKCCITRNPVPSLRRPTMMVINATGEDKVRMIS